MDAFRLTDGSGAELNGIYYMIGPDTSVTTAVQPGVGEVSGSASNAFFKMTPARHGYRFSTLGSSLLKISFVTLSGRTVAFGEIRKERPLVFDLGSRGRQVYVVSIKDASTGVSRRMVLYLPW